MSKILTRDEMTQYILDLLEKVTKDYPPEERGEAQARILAATFGGVVVKVNDEG